MKWKVVKSIYENLLDYYTQKMNLKKKFLFIIISRRIKYLNFKKGMSVIFRHDNLKPCFAEIADQFIINSLCPDWAGQVFNAQLLWSLHFRISLSESVDALNSRSSYILVPVPLRMCFGRSYQVNPQSCLFSSCSILLPSSVLWSSFLWCCEFIS